jgi:valyl-tRNA synthetase
MTRDAFVAKAQAFKDEYEAVILGQLKRMGCSCDWDRTRFTMDESARGPCAKRSSSCSRMASSTAASAS